MVTWEWKWKSIEFGIHLKSMINTGLPGGEAGTGMKADQWFSMLDDFCYRRHQQYWETLTFTIECVWGGGLCYWHLWVEANDAAKCITVHSSITKYSYPIKSLNNVEKILVYTDSNWFPSQNTHSSRRVYK